MVSGGFLKLTVEGGEWEEDEVRSILEHMLLEAERVLEIKAAGLPSGGTRMGPKEFCPSCRRSEQTCALGRKCIPLCTGIRRALLLLKEECPLALIYA